MFKKKKNKSDDGTTPDAPAPENNPNADTDGPVAKKSGLIGKILTPVALAAASFATVYFLPEPEPAVITQVADTTHAMAPITVKIEAPADLEIIELDEMTVSIGQSKQILRIAIALEAPYDSIALISPDDPRLRDAFMSYMRAIEVAQLQDASFMAQLKAQLLRRAKLVLGSENVYNVLITDFLVR